MTTPNIATLTLTIKAIARIEPKRGITLAGGVPAAGAAVAGFSRTGADIGDPVPVDVQGTTVAQTGAAIPAGAEVQVDAQGRVIPLGTGIKVGRMAPQQPAAIEVGQDVEILLIPH